MRLAFNLLAKARGQIVAEHFFHGCTCHGEKQEQLEEVPEVGPKVAGEYCGFFSDRPTGNLSKKLEKVAFVRRPENRK